MFGRARIRLTIAACALAVSAAAQAPAPTTAAFDGTYLGVSNTFEETSTADPARTWTRYCFQPSGRPEPLMILNGIARTGIYEGSVGPQGVLVMRDFWNHFDGRIDSQGTVRGRSTGACSYQLVWQKLPPPTMQFDGDYIGISKETSKTASAPEKCPPNGVPAALMIRNSVVLGYWQGTVSAQGVLTMRNQSMRFDGQIDSQGTIRGQAANPAGCVRTFVWQKERR